MTPPTFYDDETYGPRLVGLLHANDLPAVSYRDVSDIEAGDRDVTIVDFRRVDRPTPVAS